MLLASGCDFIFCHCWASLDILLFYHCRIALLQAVYCQGDLIKCQARIPEFKACAVQVFPAREEELANPQLRTSRGRY